ncbi:MAG: MFS transporter [Caldilineaceae bacterium]
MSYDHFRAQTLNLYQGHLRPGRLGRFVGDDGAQPFWLFFIVSVVGVDVELAGLAFVIGRIWDGINDPLVGMLSDRMRTRWGRRRPFMLLGALPFGVGFF